MPDYRLGRLKGQFVVVWEEGGRRRRYRLGTRDPKEARSTLREFIAQRSRLDHGRQASNLSVEDCWNAYIAEKEAEGKVSVGRMRDAWKRLVNHFGPAEPSTVSSEAVRQYISHRRGHGVSDGTIHAEVGYLRASLRHAEQNGRIRRAPNIKLPSKPRPRSRFLSSEEARRLIDAAQMPHVRLFIALALHTAGRPSSILDLTWDRVDFKAGRIHLDNPGRDRTAKGRATVPLAQDLIRPLQEAKAAALTNHVIEWAGKPVKSIKRGIQAASRRAGLEGVTPYVLRHTAAVWMIESGKVSMSEVSQFLGHTSTAVTERVYARYSPDYLRKASEAIAEKLK